MNIENFEKNTKVVIDWIKKYYSEIESYPVKSQVKPYELFEKIPVNPPENPEQLNEIIDDMNNIILPGITHWQSPKFFAYFPANTSEPSILAEMITSAVAAQCMKWETSPIAAELEERVLNWLKSSMGLPKEWSGVIQDSASSATLASLLTARELKSDYDINRSGFTGQKYTVYCSAQAHSSIERAVKIAGIGSDNLRKIDTFDDFSMDFNILKKTIQKDIESGFTPLCIVAAIGTTGSLAFDDLTEIGKIAQEYGIWFHVDAAYAGSAMILEEYRHLIKGVEYADSYVFNPHKWMFTNFDCSAYFVKDSRALINTFEIVPEYLKTKTYGQVNDYCDWGIPLGRRFRALKLWFVIRMFGINGIKEKISNHIKFGEIFENYVNMDERFELLTDRIMNVICFRYNSGNIDESALNSINEKLLHSINKTGKIFISHTKLNGKYTLRFVCGQTYLEEKHIHEAWDLIVKEIDKLDSN